MSSFHLSAGHIDMLVAAASDLGLCRVRHRDGNFEDVSLETRQGRAKLFELLDVQQPTSRTIAGEPSRGALSGVSGAPVSWFASGWMVDPSRCVQVVQWVRSYVYQCGSSSDWEGSEAQWVTSQLIDSLLDRLTHIFEARWTVDAAQDSLSKGRNAV